MAWKIDRAQENVALVTMNTNRLSFQNEAFFKDLHGAFDRLEREFPECAVVLTGTGNTFSAGLDFDESFSVFGSRDESKILHWFDVYRAINLRIFTFARPTVAAVNGHAFAGGLITALTCDYRLGTEGDFGLSLNEVPIGIPMPSVYLEMLRYAIGTPPIARAALFGERFTPREARELGIFHGLKPAESVVEAAIERAASLPKECYPAYAFSKAALQSETLARIEEQDRSFDRKVGAILGSEATLAVLARKYEEIKGHPPSWARPVR